jgi:hypothetical protein
LERLNGTGEHTNIPWLIGSHVFPVQSQARVEAMVDLDFSVFHPMDCSDAGHDRSGATCGDP